MNFINKDLVFNHELTFHYMEVSLFIHLITDRYLVDASLWQLWIKIL